MARDMAITDIMMTMKITPTNTGGLDIDAFYLRDIYVGPITGATITRTDIGAVTGFMSDLTPTTIALIRHTTFIIATMTMTD